jgi:hypothetical protein
MTQNHLHGNQCLDCHRTLLGVGRREVLSEKSSSKLNPDFSNVNLPNEALHSNYCGNFVTAETSCKTANYLNEHLNNDIFRHCRKLFGTAAFRLR